MQIEPFGVEMWMNAWETKCELNLAETCVASLTIEQLLDITGHNSADLHDLLPLKMTYGAIEGSERLRGAIAALYEKTSKDNVVVTHGTIGANMLVHRTLVSRSDRVVTIVPTYQQHYSIPASIGAQVIPLQLREEDAWQPDLDELRKLASPGTRLIAINNPNNPTGALMSRNTLAEIAQIARSVGAWVLCDEVYRGTDQSGTGTTASIADVYEKGISTASMSKAYSLAGIRLGWIAAPTEIIEAVMIHRDYDTISVGIIDDHFATLALEHSRAILSRSQSITRENLAALSAWVEEQPLISWVPPTSGTTALLRYDLPTPSAELCTKLLNDTGVLMTPGSALNMEGYLRIGYANDASILAKGLARTAEFLNHQR